MHAAGEGLKRRDGVGLRLDQIDNVPAFRDVDVEIAELPVAQISKDDAVIEGLELRVSGAVDRVRDHALVIVQEIVADHRVRPHEVADAVAIGVGERLALRMLHDQCLAVAHAPEAD